MARARSLRVECYDVGHLYNLARFRRPRAHRSRPSSCKRSSASGRYRHRPGRPHAHEAHRRPPLWRRPVWSVLGGRPQFNLVTMGAIMGSNVRVGLEDNISAKESWPSNADQVAKIVRILNELSLDATPDEAREMLHTRACTTSRSRRWVGSEPAVRDPMPHDRRCA
ncbi:MAG: 3-keto-5-aminohexanoate cleavage protein [Thermomicrobiales bacterium]